MEKVQIVESEIAKEHSNPSVVNKSLSFIKGVLERIPEHAASHLIVLGLIHQMSAFIRTYI